MATSLKRNGESFLWENCIMQINCRPVRISSQCWKTIAPTEIRPAAQVVSLASYQGISTGWPCKKCRFTRFSQWTIRIVRNNRYRNWTSYVVILRYQLVNSRVKCINICGQRSRLTFQETRQWRGNDTNRFRRSVIENVSWNVYIQ